MGPRGDVTTVVCERCGATQEIGSTTGFVCANCGETVWYVRCPGCGRPMQWFVNGPRKQTHDACGRTIRLSRRVRPPHVERGVLVEAVVPWWRAPGTDLPYALGEGDYLGGHSAAHPRQSDATVELQDEQIRVSSGLRVFTVPWADVRGVYVDSRDSVAERPVVARMAAARAFDLTRDPADSYLVVDTGGEALVFGFDMAPAELEARCRSALGLGAPVAPAPSVEAQDARADAAGSPDRSPAELLRELAALHAEGVLSDEEFAEKKAEILRRM
jgi:Short C-terminal domain